MRPADTHSSSRLHDSSDDWSTLDDSPQLGTSAAATITGGQLPSHPATEEGRGYYLLVMSADAFATVPLPARGEVVIGRSSRAGVRLEDRLASRRHLRLRLGPDITVEDLGSESGTRLRDDRLIPNQPVVVHPGEAIAIGASVLMVRQARSQLQPRRLWSHEAFESRVEDECSRASRTGGAFAVVRMRLVPEAGIDVGLSPRVRPWTRVLPVLARAVSEPHVLGAYGPDEYEALFVAQPREQIDALIAAALTALAAAGNQVAAGAAWFPEQGRSADALVAAANIRLSTSATGTAPLVRTDRLPSPCLLARATRLAGHEHPVLLWGEPGVGKETLARLAHALSPRRQSLFLTCDCTARDTADLVTELFGDSRSPTRPGLLTAAAGGTLLLRGFVDLPATLQQHLLRSMAVVIHPQAAVVDPPIGVRLVLSTSLIPDRELVGRWLVDLMERLGLRAVRVPPIRERVDEIPALADELLKDACARLGRIPPALARGAIEWMAGYGWPGNVTEMRNCLDRALMLCNGDEIRLAHLPVQKQASSSIGAVTSLPGHGPAVTEVLLQSAVGPLGSRAAGGGERARIAMALEACAWNQSRAAQQLGISRRTLLSRLDRYQIVRPTKGKGR